MSKYDNKYESLQNKQTNSFIGLHTHTHTQNAYMAFAPDAARYKTESARDGSKLQNTSQL